MYKQYSIKDISDWKDLAKNLLSLAVPKNTATVVSLSGELGAGKTTFVQALAKELGVNEVVTSPTFTIMKGYITNPASGYLRLIHMDAYRIDDLNELKPLGFAEIINEPQTIVCIEWAENIKPALPEDVLAVVIKHNNGEEREVEISI